MFIYQLYLNRSQPLFLSYPTIVQQNILLLINEFLPSIPKLYIKEFVSLIENNSAPNSWLGYLLRKLKCRISSDTTGIDDSCIHVPFNNNTLDKMCEAFCLPDQLAVTSVSLSDIYTSVSRKRSLDVSETNEENGLGNL